MESLWNCVLVYCHVCISRAVSQRPECHLACFFAGLLATHVEEVVELAELAQSYLTADARATLLAVARRRVRFFLCSASVEFSPKRSWHLVSLPFVQGCLHERSPACCAGSALKARCPPSGHGSPVEGVCTTPLYLLSRCYTCAIRRAPDLPSAACQGVLGRRRARARGRRLGELGRFGLTGEPCGAAACAGAAATPPRP